MWPLASNASLSRFSMSSRNLINIVYKIGDENGGDSFCERWEVLEGFSGFGRFFYSELNAREDSYFIKTSTGKQQDSLCNNRAVNKGS